MIIEIHSKPMGGRQLLDEGEIVGWLLHDRKVADSECCRDSDSQLGKTVTIEQLKGADKRSKHRFC